MTVTGSYGTGRSWLPLVSLPCHCQWDKPPVRLAGWDGTSLFSHIMPMHDADVQRHPQHPVGICQVYLPAKKSKGRVGAANLTAQTFVQTYVFFLKVLRTQETQMEQSKGRIINEWDILDENLHRQEAAMPFSQFVSR